MCYVFDAFGNYAPQNERFGNCLKHAGGMEKMRATFTNHPALIVCQNSFMALSYEQKHTYTNSMRKNARN